MARPPRKTLAATREMRTVAAARPSQRPPARPKSHLTRDTRTGEIYWCDFNPTNLTPEFDYQHLVVIVRGGKLSNDINVVIPLTKASQSDNPHGYRLLRNPNPGSAEESWAVCNHVYSVASERLQPLRDQNGNRRTSVKLDAEDLRQISHRLRRALNTFLTFGLPVGGINPPLPDNQP